MAAYTTIDDPTQYFEVITYSGDGNSTQNITANFQADLSWIKHRSTTAAHTIQDSVRGFNAANKLSSNENDEENDSGGATWENYGHVSAVSSSNFTVSLGANTPYQTNASGVNYIAWHWKESATAGFDIVSYTGNGSARTISHSLSAVPKMVIVKTRSAAKEWFIYHQALGNTKEIYLESTDAAYDGTSAWNSTTPTSSVFSVGSHTKTNGDGDTIIAYCFEEKQGFSKFGSYTGNANADGPFIYTGFSPSFVMAKMTSGTGNWNTFDNKRTDSSGGNVIDKRIKNNSNAAEIDGTANQVNFLSNGFKWKGTDDDTNVSGGTFIYMAFAEAPFVNSNGVPCNAR